MMIELIFITLSLAPISIKNENSLRGCFVRCMAEKMEKAENPELVYEAMVYGLKSFEGEVFFNDNP